MVSKSLNFEASRNETDDENATIREIVRKLLIDPDTLFIDYTDIVPAKDTIHLKIFKIIYFNQGRLTDAPLPRTIIQAVVSFIRLSDFSLVDNINVNQ